jgi:hypothetical protein
MVNSRFVPGHEFLFALDVPADARRLDGMLTDVAAAVLGHLGYTGQRLTEITTVLRGALAAGPAPRRQRCDVAFRAHGGELEIVVSGGGQPEFRTTLALPQSQ